MQRTYFEPFPKLTSIAIFKNLFIFLVSVVSSLFVYRHFQKNKNRLDINFDEFLLLSVTNKRSTRKKLNQVIREISESSYP